MTADLKTAKRKTASEASIEALQNYIVGNNLRENASLPTEYELTSSLKVSRSSVREALQHFRALGIIDSRPKRGTRIARLIPQQPFDAYMPYIKADAKKLDELFQVRMIIEIGMIPFLVEKVKPADINKLAALARAMNVRNQAERREADRKFHMVLSDIVGNRILANIQPAMEYFDSLENPEMIDFKRKTPEQIAQEHMEIVEALKAKDTAGLQYLFKNKHYSKEQINDCP